MNSVRERESADNTGKQTDSDKTDILIRYLSLKRRIHDVLREQEKKSILQALKKKVADFRLTAASNSAQSVTSSAIDDTQKSHDGGRIGVGNHIPVCIIAEGLTNDKNKGDESAKDAVNLKTANIGDVGEFQNGRSGDVHRTPGRNSSEGLTNDKNKVDKSANDAVSLKTIHISDDQECPDSRNGNVHCAPERNSLACDQNTNGVNLQSIIISDLEECNDSGDNIRTGEYERENAGDHVSVSSGMSWNDGQLSAQQKQEKQQFMETCEKIYDAKNISPEERETFETIRKRYFNTIPGSPISIPDEATPLSIRSSKGKCKRSKRKNDVEVSPKVPTVSIAQNVKTRRRSCASAVFNYNESREEQNTGNVPMTPGAPIRRGPGRPRKREMTSTGCTQPGPVPIKVDGDTPPTSVEPNRCCPAKPRARHTSIGLAWESQNNGAYVTNYDRSSGLNSILNIANAGPTAQLQRTNNNAKAQDEPLSAASSDMELEPSPVHESKEIPIPSFNRIPIKHELPSVFSAMVVAPATTVNMKSWLSGDSAKLACIAPFMLHDAALFALFKCMAKHCAFTCQSKSLMAEHLKCHEKQAGTWMLVDYLECAYCSTNCLSAMELIEHTEETHSGGIFQCQYCFYRSADAYAVVVHQDEHHHGKHPTILLCKSNDKSRQARRTHLEDMMRKQKSNIRPILCDQGVSAGPIPGMSKGHHYAFYAIDHYISHLKKDHSIDSDHIRCTVCSKILAHGEIKQHLYCHRISNYHCLHCPYTAMDLDKMTHHMSDLHPEHLMFTVARYYRSDLPLNQTLAADSIIILNLADTINPSTVRFRELELNDDTLDSVDPKSTIASAAELMAHQRNCDSRRPSVASVSIINNYTTRSTWQQFVTMDDFRKNYQRKEFCLWETIKME